MNEHTRMADGLAVSSILTYIGSWLVEATPILQAVALIASIIAAVTATYYHIRRGHSK